MALYDTIGQTYAQFRRADARIAGALAAALGDAASIVNVGAGSGSYEPSGRTVTAVEPSAVMIGQRPPSAAPCLQAFAEALPLATDSTDAAMAILTLHHWSNLKRGLAEMARVARRRVVILTWIPDAEPFWLTRDYFPEIMADDRRIFPNSDTLVALLQRVIGPTRLLTVPIPHDCTDGFLCAYWRRPEAYLNAAARGAMSSFAKIDSKAGLARLAHDLSTGRWQDRNRALTDMNALDCGYRIAVCDINRRSAA